jgi:hypothetical protein
VLSVSSRARSTDDDEHVVAHELVVVVKWECLYDIVENERNSSAQSSKIGQELI